MENQKKLGASAFLPLIVFLVLYVGCGITFTLLGVESPFGQFPRHVALLAGIAVALRGWQRMREVGGSVLLRHVAKQPRKVFEASGVGRMMTIE